MVNQVPVNTIEITEKAANKVKTFAEQDGKSNFALRVAVKGGGCSGLTYDLEITDKDASSDEKIIIQHDVEVLLIEAAGSHWTREGLALKQPPHC